jgi:primase-polymerase (primpol)-like protein
VELYSEKRYVTMTGYRLAELPATVEDRTPQIAELYYELFGTDTPATTAPEFLGSDLSDDALLALALRNAKFAALWSGDTSAYPSHSEADCALCCFLSYWTGRDPARIDRLFRRSGLCRDKWDRRDYRERTISHVIAVTEDVYRHIPDIDLPATDAERLRAIDVEADWTGDF